MFIRQVRRPKGSGSVSFRGSPVFRIMWLRVWELGFGNIMRYHGRAGIRCYSVADIERLKQFGAASQPAIVSVA